MIPGVLVRRDSVADALPLLFDSPHSGNVYPEGFETLVARDVLRQAEDAFVDELYDSAPRTGAAFLAALFPRVYIDLNRSLADMDPDLVEGGWPEGSTDNFKVRLGMGLIWRTHYPDLPLYPSKLSRDEVMRRIEGYYRPYREELLAMLDGLHARFGQVVHVNCHSMPSVSSLKSREGPGKRRPDVVLGDADGASCDPRLTRLAQDVFEGRGFGVAINDPYNGADLIRAHSDPAAGRHSLQIEINRALYMDETAIAKTPGFGRMREATTALIAAFADHVRRA